MIKTFVFKLYNSKHNRCLHRQINAAGLIYNHCIALHKRYYRLFGQSLSLYKLQHHLVKLKKKSIFKYLNELNSQAVQDVVERINRAYLKFFHDLKRGVKTSPPKFKKVRRYKSFTLKQCGYKLLDSNKIKLRDRIYKYFKSREIGGKVKTITVKRDALGDIWLYFACEINQSELQPRSGKSVGYDFGLKKFLTASDGNDIIAPLFFALSSKAVKKANKKLSNKKKGSHNRERTRLNLARKHRKIANQRHDFHFKTARTICDEYALVCLEDLNLKGMSRLYGRKIHDYGLYNFIQILEYIAKYKFSTVIQKVDRFFPSSQLCNVCGFQNKEVKNLSVREWDCPVCGTHHDRDRNAAINIERQGVVSLGLGDVRPKAI